ncbi:MAG TPA: hypothetical protein VN282_25630 [Pyrinomonadaceae bacterium]|nr:hypothetical protein [Pyrinomonadaceae bacterium]
MPRSKYSFPLIVLLLISVASLMSGSITRAGRPAAQDAEKSLDIERYPGEPLELVGLKIGGQPVKDKVVAKSRRNGEGLDTVKFKENAGWFRRIRATVRNVSGRPILGLRAYLYFKSTATGQMFSLPLSRFRQRKGGPLQPGEELDLLVDDRVWKPMADVFSQYGEDPDLSDVTISVENVTFSPDLQWHRGKFLRPDPADPNMWRVIDDKAPPEAGELRRPAQFLKAAFTPTVRGAQARFVLTDFTLPEPPRQSSDRCEEEAGRSTTACNESSLCRKKKELGAGDFTGAKTAVPVVGLCEEENYPQVDDPNINCAEMTTHERLQPDESCPCLADMSQEGSDNGYGMCLSCYDGRDNDCNGYTDLDDWGCIVCQSSPVLVDVLGDGFRLTSAADGVAFDINGDGTTERLSWTAANVDDAWLALDRNADGRIDSGKELFGNFTPQPESGNRNGFLALAEYDKAESGGNRNGVIDAGDAVFASLRLWQDVNRDGVSEQQELRTLRSLGIARMHLDYKESKTTDEHGNQFRYRAKVDDAKGAKVNRWAWDVFLVLRR